MPPSTTFESIGFVSIGHGKSYIIAELMVHKGRGCAMLVFYNAGNNRWHQETTQNPLPKTPTATGEWGEWVPSGVVCVSFKKTTPSMTSKNIRCAFTGSPKAALSPRPR